MCFFFHFVLTYKECGASITCNDMESGASYHHKKSLDQPAVNRLHFVCTNLSLLCKGKNPCSDLLTYIFCFLFSSFEVGKVVDSMTLRHQVVEINIFIKNMQFLCVTGDTCNFLGTYSC